MGLALQAHLSLHREVEAEARVEEASVVEEVDTSATLLISKIVEVL